MSKPRDQMTFEEIVLDILQHLCTEEIDDLKQLSSTQLHGLHHGFGTNIRNEYGLWHTSPLTEKWRTDEEGRDIRGGVDYSTDHPDSISMQIIDEVFKRLKI